MKVRIQWRTSGPLQQTGNESVSCELSCWSFETRLSSFVISCHLDYWLWLWVCTLACVFIVNAVTLSRMCRRDSERWCSGVMVIVSFICASHNQDKITWSLLRYNKCALKWFRYAFRLSVVKIRTALGGLCWERATFDKTLWLKPDENVLCYSHQAR